MHSCSHIWNHMLAGARVTETFTCSIGMSKMRKLSLNVLHWNPIIYAAINHCFFFLLQSNMLTVILFTEVWLRIFGKTWPFQLMPFPRWKPPLETTWMSNSKFNTKLSANYFSSKGTNFHTPSVTVDQVHKSELDTLYLLEKVLQTSRYRLKRSRRFPLRTTSGKLSEPVGGIRRPWPRDTKKCITSFKNSTCHPHHIFSEFKSNRETLRRG
jgi:hypothetical protein